MLRRKPQALISQIDMTPMAGILNSLIVFFIVTTPIYGCGVNVDLPQISSAWPSVEDKPEMIAVGMSRGRTVFFKGVKLEDGLPELQERLRAYIADNPDIERIVHLKADVETRFSAVTDLISACRKAGATDIRLIAEPLFESPLW
jgi:biopolymer transport protein ExbD